MAHDDTLTPDQLLEVLGHLDPPNKRWRQKVRLLGIIGRWGDVHELGVRELAERTGWGIELVTHLVGELVAARIVLVWREAAGTRATAYLVNRRLEQWGTDPRGGRVGDGVPWSQPLAAVRLWVFHVEHEPYAEPRQRAALGTSAARSPEQRAAVGTSAARRARHARGPRAQARALAEAAAQEGFLLSSDPELSSPPVAGAGGEQLRDDAGFRRVVAAVKAAAKAPFLEGAPRDELAELYRQVGGEQIIEWLPQSPVTGAPRLVSWLVDQQHKPDDELLARLAERERQEAAYEDAIATGRLKSPEPPAGPVLHEFRGFDHERGGDPEAIRAARREARSHLVGEPTPTDDAGVTMESSAGGAPR